MIVSLLQTAPDAATLPGLDLLRSFAALVIVFGLLGVLAWLARRGTFGRFAASAKGPIAVEASLPLGDRRSLMVVTIEGRRLLLGLTPMQVSLVTELRAGDVFTRTLDRTLADAPPSTEPPRS